MRRGEREEDRQQADLRRQPEADEDAGEYRVPKPAPRADTQHEVDGQDGAEGRDRVDGEEVAELDVNDRERDQRRRQNRLAAAVHSPAQQVDDGDRPHVREGGDDPPQGAQVVPASAARRVQGKARHGLVGRRGGAQQVERKAAVREPSGVPRAFVGVEQDANVCDGRQRELRDVGQDGPLVRMRRVTVPAVPVDPVEPEHHRDQDDRGEGDEVEPVEPPVASQGIQLAG